jgi:hypothetical protein
MLIAAGVDEAGRQFAGRCDSITFPMRRWSQKLKKRSSRGARRPAKADALTSAGLVDEAAEAFVDAC